MKVFRSPVLKLILLVSLVTMLVATPVLAALSAQINGVTRDNCVITLNVTVGDGGTYYLQVFDDSQLIDEQSFTASTGQTLDVQYIIKKPAGTFIPGIGLVIADGPFSTGNVLDLVDPFVFPDDVANSCAASYVSTGTGGCQLIVPEGSVVGDLPFATQAYWAPGKVSPGVTLNPGTYWAVAAEPDDTGRLFYKIVLACQFVYVPADSMQPSFQPPWNGQPLPLPKTDA